MKQTRAAVLAACLVACGGSTGEPPPRFPNPEPVVARREPKQGAAEVACARGPSYDWTSGCLVAGSGMPLRVSFRDDTSAAFRLIGVALALDGEPIFDANDPGLIAKKRFPGFTTRAEPGEHEVGVRLYYAGNGYGVFAYLKGYRFQTQRSLRFVVPAGRDVALSAVGYEKGGPATPIERRLAVRVEAEP